MPRDLQKAALREQPAIIGQDQPRTEENARHMEFRANRLGLRQQRPREAPTPHRRSHRQPGDVKAIRSRFPEHRAGQHGADLGHRATMLGEMSGDLRPAHPERRGWRIEPHRLGGEGDPDQAGHGLGVGGPHWPQARRGQTRSHVPTIARSAMRAYVGPMPATPAFLDSDRPAVPNIVVPRGVTPFFLPRRPVRGRLVRLGPLAEALLTRHANPDAVTRLTGEALALAAGLAAALKFRGSFSLQAKGDGAVPMLLADCTDTGGLRGYARADRGRLGQLLASDPAPGADRLLGSGYLAFTVDQGPEQHRHQGIVTIEGDNLADMALHYFRTSEQLRCGLHLACAKTDAGWRAGALILERIAQAGEVDPDLSAEAQEESWRTAVALAATLTDAELLDDALPADRLLYRLFHTEGVAVHRARALSYGCRCSRARLTGILEGFPPEDLDHMAVDGDIVMTCEFCNFAFRFPREEV